MNADVPYATRRSTRRIETRNDLAMPILDPIHDLAHAVEGDTAWSESYYFNGYDEPTDSGFFTRIGVRPNEGTMDVGLSIWLPGKDLAEYRNVKEQHESAESPLVVGDVCYEMVEPMKTWRLTADADAPARACVKGSMSDRTVHLKLDMTFEALSEGIGSDGSPRGPQSAESSAASGTTGKGHLEQAGRWNGVLEVDGTKFEWVNARGNRDRSWGPRRWGGPTMWRWFSINIDDELHFGGIRLGTGDADLHRGWVWESGRATSVAEWQLSTELAEDGLSQKTVHMVVVDKKGRTYDLLGEVLRVADIGRAGGTVVNEGLTKWIYSAADGSRRTGFGVAEYLHQVNDAGLPVVPIE